MTAKDDLLEAVAEALARLAEEFAFAEPGSDTGLLPVNALLMDLEQLPAQFLPPSLATAFARPRAWIDATLDGSGKFDAATLGLLHDWHGWVIDSLMSESTGGPAPALPQSLLETSPADAALLPTDAEPVVAESGPAPVATSAAAPVPASAPAPAPAPAVVSAPAPAPVARVEAPPVPPAATAAPADTNIPSMVLKLPGDLELLREFHSESLELLRSIEQAVLTLEENPGASEAINAIFRAFHTFKGSAGFLQLLSLRDFAHELESLLEVVRSGEAVVTRAVIDAILAGADVLAECTSQVGVQVAGHNPGAPIPVPGASVLALVTAALRGEPVAPAPAPPAPAPAPVAAVAPSEGAVVASPVAQASPPKPVAVPATSREPAVADSFVRLDAAKLDDLVNLVGELVVAQSFVLESAEVRGSPNLELAHSVRKLVRITRGLQHNAMSLRMAQHGTAEDGLHALLAWGQGIHGPGPLDDDFSIVRIRF